MSKSARKPVRKSGASSPTTSSLPSRFSFVRKLTRDLFLFILGVAIIVNEVWFQEGPERTQILILATGLVGAPFVIRAEEARRNGHARK